MIGFISTTLVLLVLAGVVVLAARAILKDKKSGKGCAGCSGSCSRCHHEPSEASKISAGK